ncbi:MAG: type IV pilin N-terminal domain-containing protein [Methanolinea sp.]|nr:type IV pilin N-terminal domain-containing protein [Methanolinea sp.]
MRKKDEAVSPVVGVMLMLVVTIVIAAMVSAFAGSLGSSEQKVPQASIVAKEFVIQGVIDTDSSPAPGGAYGQGLARPDQGATNPAPDIYILFQHNGGDPINLDRVEMQLGKLSEPGVGTVLSRALAPQTGPNLVASQSTNGATIGDKSQLTGYSLYNSTGAAVGWDKYLAKYPDYKNTIVVPGDQFVLHADYGARDDKGRDEVAWLKQGGSYAFTIREGDVLTYDLIDTATKKVIASGQIFVPEFSVRTS